MKILAIDPGYERLGIAVLEKISGKEIIVHSECFRTPKGIAFEKRLVMIGDRIKTIVRQYAPERLAIETLFFNTNQKTATKVAEVRGLIMYAAASEGLTVNEYTPLQIKMAVSGYGRSGKDQVIDMVKKLIKIDKPNVLDDEYDAIAVGLTDFACTKSPKIKH